MRSSRNGLKRLIRPGACCDSTQWLIGSPPRKLGTLKAGTVRNLGSGSGFIKYRLTLAVDVELRYRNTCQIYVDKASFIYRVWGVRTTVAEVGAFSENLTPHENL